MCYIIAATGDCPFCKATLTRHAWEQRDPRRATHTIADPLTGDDSDDALLRMPFKQARVAAIDAFD